MTTMSDRVSLMVQGVHAALMQALLPGVEPVASVLTQVLKVCGVVLGLEHGAVIAHSGSRD